MVQDFITPELGFSIIPAGVQRFNLHYLLPTSNSDLEGYIELQLADSTGTPIGSTITSNVSLLPYVDAINPGELNVDVVLPTTSISPTNRMIVRLYLNNLDSTLRSVIFYTEGNANYSYVITSVGQIAAATGATGETGPTGATGETGPTGPGATLIIKENITLAATGWVSVGSPISEWEYDLVDSDIELGSVVDFVPYNAFVPAVQAAQIYPYIDVQNGFATITAPGNPTGPSDITGQLTIIK